MGDQSFTTDGSTDLQHVGAHARVAYDVSFSNFYLRPQLALDATYVHVDGFTERGSSFALDVESQDDLSFSATPAIEIGANLDLGNGTWLRPFAKAGVIFHNGNDWRTSVRFADGEGRFVSSTELPDAIAQFSAGLELTTSRGLDLTVGYDGQMGDDYEAHRGVVNMVYRF